MQAGTVVGGRRSHGHHWSPSTGREDGPIAPLPLCAHLHTLTIAVAYLGKSANGTISISIKARTPFIFRGVAPGCPLSLCLFSAAAAVNLMNAHSLLLSFFSSVYLRLPAVLLIWH